MCCFQPSEIYFDLASLLMICLACESVSTVMHMILSPYNIKGSRYLASLRGLRFAVYFQSRATVWI